jgi:hypothetical protein
MVVSVATVVVCMLIIVVQIVIRLLLMYWMDSYIVSHTGTTCFLFLLFLAQVPVVDSIVRLISMKGGYVGSFVVFDPLWSYLDVFCFSEVWLFKLFLLSGPLWLLSFSFV